MWYFNLLEQLRGSQIKGEQFWRTHGLRIIDKTRVQNPQSLIFVDLIIIRYNTIRVFFLERKINSEKIIVQQFCERSRFQSNLRTWQMTNQDTVVEVVHRCQFYQIPRSKRKAHHCILLQREKSCLERKMQNMKYS